MAIINATGALIPKVMIIGLSGMITKLCNTHNPKSVKPTNNNSSRLTFVPVVLKVCFLFIIKLNTNATEVAITTTSVSWKASEAKIYDSHKSSAVLAPPIAIKRAILLFFSVSVMVLVYQIEWSALGLFKNTANVFTDNP